MNRRKFEKGKEYQMLKELRLLRIIAAFGHFGGKPMAVLDSARSVSEDQFDAIEASLHRLAANLEWRANIDRGSDKLSHTTRGKMRKMAVDMRIELDRPAGGS
jgi:hypothetical protein